jgi:hypothetical protein
MVSFLVLIMFFLHVEKVLVSPESAQLLEKFADVHKESIKYMVDIGNLIINWSTAILAGLSIALSQYLKNIGKISITVISIYAISFLSCIISIWLGLVVLDIIVLSLAIEQAPWDNKSLHICRQGQYLTFIFGLMMFCFSWILALCPKFQIVWSDKK